MKTFRLFRALRRAACAAASVLFALSASGETTQVFYESFDECNGTGGNDGQWSGSIASSSLKTDNAGWSSVKGNGAKKCAKFGTGSALGSATTPALGTAGTLTLTFRAAAWSGDKTTLALSIAEGGGSLDKSTVTLASAQWSDYSVVISNATAATKVTFSATTANKNRFFLDEVTVVQGTVEPTPAAPDISVSPTTANVALGNSVSAVITTNDAVTSVTASVGTISDNTWSWTPTSVGTTTVRFTATGAAGTTPATATLSVTVTQAALAVPVIAAASDLLSNGTGFTANWSAVTGVTGYQVQVATNAQFDAVENVVLEEHFDTLTATARPDGWDGNLTTDLSYGSGYSGDAAPAYKLRSNNQWLESPSFQGGTSLSFFAKPNGGTGSSIAILETSVNGASTTTTTHDPISLENTGKIYSVPLTGNATKVKFTFTKSVNVGLDDIVIYGPPGNAVVKSAAPSGANATSFAFTGLAPNTVYYVRVLAQKDGQVSDWSDTVTVTTAAGQTNYAPEITAFSPATATVTLGSSQAFSLGYSDVNHNDTLTLAVTDNGAPLATESLSGTSGTHSYSYAAAIPGTHTLGFTVTDAAGLSASTNAIVTVPVPVPTLSPVDAETILSDGTGFTVEWSETAVATGYEVQIATNALFDAASEIVLEEHFGALKDDAYPDGWTGSGISDLDYSSGDYHGEALPAFKFKGARQTLTSPIFENGGIVSFFARPNTKPGSTFTVTETPATGSDTTYQPITITEGGTYEQELSGTATRLVFTMASHEANVIFDDVVVRTTPYDSIVRTLTPAAGTTSTNVVELLPNTTYFVRVRALYGDGASVWSAAVSATTPAGVTAFPPELSVTPASVSIAGGETARFTVAYSDPNAGDTLSLSVSLDGGAAQPLDLASGGTYAYTPVSAGAHRLVFAVSDGQFTTASTNDVEVALAAPVASAASGQTENPWGFGMAWGAVALAEAYAVEVATDPLFEEALGAPVMTEDFSTMTKDNPPAGWVASSDGSGNATGLMYTGTTSSGDLAPSFRFGNNGETLESPTFPAARFVSFFGYVTKGSGNTVSIAGKNGDEVVNTVTVALAEGRGTYSVEFSEPVTKLKFTYYKDGGNFGLDDIVVRDVAARDSTVWSDTINAPATSAAVTDLANARAYYYRVRATSGTAVSEWSAPVEVLFLEAPANVRYEAGKYLDDGYAVAWDAAYGATTYRVVVRESRTEPHVPILSEDFASGKVATGGWVFNEVDEYTSTGSSGEAPKSIKFDAEEQYILTPRLDYPAESVSFWCKANGTGGGTLRVESYIDGEWQIVRDLSPTTAATGETVELPIPAETRRLRVTLTRKGPSTNFALDDFVVLGTGPVFYDFGTFTTTGTSLPLVGAHAERLFQTTVTALSDGGEVSAPVLEGMSPPNNPVTLIRIR